MFGIGVPELLILLVIVLVIFGAGKLPKVMGDLGRGVNSFKKAMDEPDAPADKPKTIEGESSSDSEKKA
ncbi:twin-arginine translocase TatA/TatE family subunit [Magnetofaba australis]|uniref:Sec-independent protein translocase protein TatA n=1 Tax=Magnetofaba australis IT-1 TaxID=1434232 RepID=A0A1Y2K432_9PROT|nr:twin-arginine translocase TatA/TatE family subunit [Magnetofaba australis]OSM02417.1 putative twin arginine-targeting protein translocase [Magnetofaba australis IT-1]